MESIVLAKTAGFCYGVRRSVEMAEALLENCRNAYSMGPIIHNTLVVDKLEKQGLRVAESADDIPKGAQVMLRAHGVSESVCKALEDKGAVITDGTCPNVKKIHKIVRAASEAGETVLVIGMAHHPEVEAIWSRCSDCIVLPSPEEAELWVHNNPHLWTKAITVVAQTTQTSDNFNECCKKLKKRCTNLKLYDTICNATSMRQKEAKALSQSCDAMIVIGSRHSANSVHLAEICKESCEKVFFIENADELDLAELAGCNTVGITAGASAPAWIIKEVRNIMDEVKVNETAIEKEPSFDEMLEETLKPIYNGDKVTGVVVAITGTEISVDLGTKYSGFIFTNEFTDAGVDVANEVKVGDTIEAIVVRVNDVEGTAQLSKKRLDADKGWNEVEAAVESGAVLEGTVVEENKGGVVVNVKGIRVFVPASQTDLPREAELSQLLKKTVKLKISEVNKARKRVVGSIRKVAQAERRAAIEALWNEMEVGKKYHGTVKSLTSYGAFVDIGGVDGMVHVSELTWGRITKPADVVAVGDEIDVYVINFDREKRKISLGCKDPEANPWTLFTGKYNVGDVAEVKIVKLMPFGAFAEVLPGADGLIHISQMANHRVAKPEDVVAVGDVVEAKITAIDEEKHKISLSIRALGEPAPAEAAPAEEPAAEE